MRYLIRSGAAIAAVAGMLLTGAPATAASASDRRPVPDTAGLAGYLKDRQAREDLPGLSAAVVHGDRVLRTYTEGVSGDGEPVTDQTPFLIGSVSKPITATLVLGLVEQGLVGLEDQVRRHLPAFRTADEATAARVTIRHLLNHTSGLPEIAGRGLTDRFDNDPGGLSRSLRDLADVRPIAEPGARHEYSGANYIVLGALVEAVTGRTFADHLRSALIEPLELRHTAATAAEAARIGLPAGHRTYLGRPQRFDSPYDTSGAPYGYLAASLTDLTRFASAQLEGGRYGQSRLLAPESVEQMQRGTTALPSGGAYGLGWRDTKVDPAGTRIVWHAGSTPGYFAHLLLVPDAGLAVVVLANRYSLADDAALAGIGFDLVRMLTGGSAAPAAADPVLTWLAPALLALAGGLTVALAATVVRGVRRLRAGPRPGRRAVVTGTAWSIGYLLLAAAAVRGLPRLFGADGLSTVSLWMPDLGHALTAVAILGVVTASTRIGLTLAATRTTR
ncbi:serine hydrolase domain-containing protein [Micromonospora sp. SH-82]|uniref:serine hydrolase domain-containing protein n=1 Tax=Micromonospora sp. SH-82 TaxID=3132938 RepID=UPI003EB97C03